MSQHARKPRTAPIIQCHASTAAALGARLIRHPAEARRLGPAWFPVRGHDGSCWAWPLERDFLAAIERH
jgi:hypothetical protein